MGELYLIEHGSYSPDTGQGLKLLISLSMEDARELDHQRITNTSDHTRLQFLEDQRWSVDDIQEWLTIVRARLSEQANIPGFRSPILEKFAYAVETAAQKGKQLYFVCD